MSRTLYPSSENRVIEESLYPRVLLSLEKAKKSFYIRLFALWSTLAVVFSPVTFYLLETLHQKLIESSAYEYVSLFINDADARSFYAKDILLALYDTVPVMGATVTLLSLVLVMVFYYKAMKYLTQLSFGFVYAR